MFACRDLEWCLLAMSPLVLYPLGCFSPWVFFCVKDSKNYIICICVCILVCLYLCICACVFVFAHFCLFICICVCVLVCLYLRICACLFICVFVYLCTRNHPSSTLLLVPLVARWAQTAPIIFKKRRTTTVVCLWSISFFLLKFNVQSKVKARTNNSCLSLMYFFLLVKKLQVTSF